MGKMNRAAVFAKMHKVLKKHFHPVPPPERSILDHLIFACLLENSPYSTADLAFEKLRANAYDWNEVRVTTVTELAELFRQLPDPKAAATRVKRTLQGVFESQYSFDMDHIKKQNLGKTEKDLAKLSGPTPFAISYLTQHALGGHAIPIDEGAIECMYIVGAIDEKEKAARAVPGLERAIPKKSGIEFGSLLHQLSADFTQSPYSTGVKEILLEIDPEAAARLPKRQRKKAECAEAEAAADAKSAVAKPDGVKSDTKDPKEAKETKDAKKSSAKKEAPTKNPSPPKPTEKPAPSKDVTAKKKESPAAKPPAKNKTNSQSITNSTTPKKKTSSKNLSRRKPR
jgi:endonuclease-3